MEGLRKRLEELHYAVMVTKTAFKYCDTPALKDLYLRNIDYYLKEIIIAESQLLVYSNEKLKEDL